MLARIFGLVFCAGLLLIGTADANPYGYSFYRTVTIDHTKVGVKYAYSRSVTIDHTKVGTVSNADQTNFPVLISGTYNGSGGTFDARTAANGGTIQNTVTFNSQTVPADLIFTADSACSTNLSWEVASYTASTGQIEVWVQVPTVSHTSDTVIYMCYDDATTTTYQGGAVGAAWDSNYKGVWHLGGSSLSVKDSTSNANNGAQTSLTSTAGEFGGGASYPTSGTPRFNVTTYVTAGMTAEMWVHYTNPGPGTYQGLYTSLGTNGWNFRVYNSAGTIYVYDDAGGGSHITSCTPYPAGGGMTPSPLLTDGNWHHLVGVYNATHIIVYEDGAVLNNCTGTFSSIDASTGQFGALFNISGDSWSGSMDEFRWSATSRSADWIKTEYNNQSFPDKANGAGGFYTMGSQTTGAGGGNDLTNFPVLISGTYVYLATGASNANGQIQLTTTLNSQTVPVDLIFTSDAAGQNYLNWEVASYTASSGKIEMWVKIPTLSHTTDTVIYMWYNNANIAATYLGNATSTWDGNCGSVWHLANGTTLSPNDSTSSANNGTLTNGPTATTGQIDGAVNIADTYNEYIAVGQTGIAPTTITVEQWVSYGRFATNNTYNFENYSYFGSPNQENGYSVNATTAGNVIWYTCNTGTCDSMSSNSTLSTGTWYHVAVTSDGTNKRIYINGALDKSSGWAHNITYRSPKAAIGKGIEFSGQFGGIIDETRISSTARSADWIKTEYNNQNSPPTFYTVGSQVQVTHHAKGFAG